jgi:GDP-4-dehydro-6-deoxy-D-mannose reductase
MASYERILLTGGAGFVGSYLSEALETEYPYARRIALVRPGEAFASAGWTPFAADLLDESAVEKTIADFQPDLVVHLAGQASIGQALGAAEQTWRVNFHGTFAIASAIARHAPGATVLFSSSATVYGESLRGGPADESAPLRPLDCYARSKAAAEAALADLLRNEAQLIIVRPVNHSGPRQNSAQFVLPSFAAQIAAIEAGRREPRLRVGDLSRARDFLDIRDVVEAYLGLIRKGPNLPERVNIFNVASGEQHSIRSLLDKLHARSRVDFSEEIDERLLRPSGSEIHSISCDSSRLRGATGWRPQHSIDDLLQSLLDYWREAERTAR